jgi:hypothetical protein
LSGQLVATLLSESFLTVALSAVAGFGGALVLTLDALVAGGQYCWDTVQTNLTQQPSRLSVEAGQTQTHADTLVNIRPSIDRIDRTARKDVFTAVLRGRYYSSTPPADTALSTALVSTERGSPARKLDVMQLFLPDSGRCGRCGRYIVRSLRKE